MNHIYKVIFNRSLGRSQVVSELASGAGKTTASKAASAVKGVVLAASLGVAPLGVAPVMAAEFNLPTSSGTTGAVDSGQSGTAAVAPVTTDADTYNLILGNSLTGGDGAKGVPNASGVAGNGGNGGAGIEVDGGSNIFNFDGDVTGGAAGGGGQGLIGSSTGGFPGTAANAIQVDGADNQFNLTGNLTGGRGGNGGFGGTSRNGGTGAAAIGVNGSGNTITIDGATVTGGNGGDRGNFAGSGTLGGTGGVAVQLNGSGNRLITNGSLSGGAPGLGSTAVANAVQVSGSGNTVELQNGYSFGGDVVVQSGTHTLALGGTADTSFDTALLVGSQPAQDGVTQFVGFSNLEKTGTSTWTLTGTRGDSGTTTITQGTLIGNAAALGSGNITNNAALTLEQVADGTYSGVISGSGDVDKTGAGTLTLTGANTFSGSTTISAGTLAIGSGGTTGSYAGDITNNAALQFNRSDALTYAGVISGGGSLTQAGTGTTTLTGTNTYSGGTTISAGTLAIGSGGTTGSISGDITNNAALQFNRSDALTYAGVISGSGSLTQAGTGTTTLTGTNTYSGGTTVSAGTLAIGSGGTTGSISGDVTNNAALQFNRSDALTYAGVISGSGSLTQAGTGTTTLTGTNTYSGGTTISAGTLAIGSGGTTGSISGDVTNNAALQFNRSDALTYAGAISGSGAVTQAGSGMLTLTGTNTYSGATTVDAGTLVVNGSIANSTVDVNDGATLMGAGTIGGLNLNSGGTLATGNSIDTLTVDGDVVFEAGSVFEVEVEADGSTDVLAATGTATINGGTVDVQASEVGTWSSSTDFSILTADGGVTGEFDNVTSNLAFLTPTLSYDSDSVQLNLTRNDIAFADMATKAPETAVANALETIYQNDPAALDGFFTSFLALSEEDAATALKTLNGSSLTGLSNAIAMNHTVIELHHVSRLTFGSQLLARRDTQPIYLVSNDTDVNAAAVNAAETNRHPRIKQGLWIQAVGGKGEADETDQTYASETDLEGLSIGFDFTLPNNAMAGIALSRFKSETEYNDLADTSDLRQSYLTLYLQQQRGKLWLNGVVGMGSAEIDTGREIVVGATVETAKGDTDGSELFGYFEAAYDMGNARFNWQPVAGLAIADIQVDEFFETGAGALNLFVEEQKRSSVASRLGARMTFRGEASPFATELYAFWAHEFADLNNSVTMRFVDAGNVSYSLRDGDRERDSLEWGASGIYSFSDSAALTASFGGTNSSTDSWLTGSIGLQKRW